MMVEPAQDATGSLSRLSRRQTWILVIVLLLVSVIWIGIDWINRTLPIVPHHELAAGALQWQPLVVMEDVALSLPPLVVSNTLVFVGAQGEEDPALTVLDLETGEMRWQQTALALTRPRGWPDGWPWRPLASWRWSGLMAADGNVYAVEAYLLETAVNAYSLASGQRLWHHKLGVVNGSDADYAALAENRVGVRINQADFSAFYLLDQETGYIQKTRQGNAGLVFWMEDEPGRIYEASVDTVRVSQATPWSARVNGCGIEAQVTATVVLVRAQACGSALQAQAFALDRQTGRELWRYERGIVSNLAVDESRVAFLTTAGQLLVLEAETGQELAVLVFTPDMLAFAPPEGQTASFFVAVRQGLLAVYFGDSGQLFAYRRIEP